MTPEIEKEITDAERTKAGMLAKAEADGEQLVLNALARAAALIEEGQIWINKETLTVFTKVKGAVVKVRGNVIGG